MSLIINHNLSALNTQRQLGISNSHLSKSLEKLSSGYKINVAADDPSGLIISEQLRSQTNGLERAIRNSQEASNVIGIAEGALIEMNEILRKLRSMALHASNSGVTAPDQVRADQSEVDSSIQTIDRIATTTRYSDQFLLNGSKGLVFDRVTSVDDSMDLGLLDVDATRIDQIFKREGVTMSVAFSGIKSSDQADYTKEAQRAYFEADNANAAAQINGNVITQRQEFFLTGTQGSRLFNFAENTNLGTIVDSINNVKESTGVAASLIFASDTVPDATATSTTAATSNATRVAGQVQIYGADVNNYGSGGDNRKVTAVTVGAANDFRVGMNTDGHGRVFAKVVDPATDAVEWYKDEAMTMLIGTQSGFGAGNFTATNGSGVTNLQVDLSAANAVVGDVYTVTLVGQEMNTGANFDANITGVDTWTSISMNTSCISGVELGKNTSVEGALYFRASGADDARKIEVFKDSRMLPDDLVATGTADLGADGGDGRQIRIEAVTDADGNSTNLNMTLSFTGAANDGGEETGVIQFNNLGIRTYSNDYGSLSTVRIQNKQGQLFHQYNAGDNTTIEMVEEGATVQLSGADAEIALNGAPLGTDGLTANVTTPDFSGALTFEQGKLGEARIAQVGYETGALFSRATALQTVSEPMGTTTLTTGYTWATNARHQTTESLTNFIGGMQYQLGGGDGDQERTVYGIESMAAANLGRIEIDDTVYTLQDVLAGGVASLQNDPVTALRVVTQAINDVSDLRARLGAFQKNMLQTNVNSLTVAVENIVKTESAIRDADMAAETTEFTKNQILLQAGTAMLAQANTASQNILQLLG